MFYMLFNWILLYKYSKTFDDEDNLVSHIFNIKRLQVYSLEEKNCYVDDFEYYQNITIKNDSSVWFDCQ